MKAFGFLRRRTTLLSGALGIVAAVAPAARAQTVLFYEVGKRIDYVQSSTATPVLGIDPRDPAGSYVFDADVTGSSLSSLPTPTVTPPGGSAKSLEFDSAGGGWHIYGPSAPNGTYNYAAKSSLDSNYPNGAYVMNINSTNISLAVAGAGNADAYPADIPTVTNNAWSGGNLSFSATQSFTFNFNAFSTYSSGTYGGSVEFSIYATDGLGNPTTKMVDQLNINGSAADLLTYNLAANALAGLETYFAQLDFTQVMAFDNSSISGASGVGYFENETTFYITTLVPEPAITGWLAGLAAVAAALGRRDWRRATLLQRLC